jgi:tRNA-Thr(GGU) m(6)t(6)A37 methyltransferase TsaA
MMEIQPIGYVRNSAEEKTNWDDLISEIEILPEYEDGLYRIEEMPEIFVLFYFDRSEEIRMRVHPMHDHSIPEVGVFASRSPTRPNFLGLSRVRLLERRGNILVVKGLDALNGTPVLDIKPAVPWDKLDKKEK